MERSQLREGAPPVAGNAEPQKSMDSRRYLAIGVVAVAAIAIVALIFLIPTLPIWAPIVIGVAALGIAGAILSNDADKPLKGVAEERASLFPFTPPEGEVKEDYERAFEERDPYRNMVMFTDLTRGRRGEDSGLRERAMVEHGVYDPVSYGRNHKLLDIRLPDHRGMASVFDEARGECFAETMEVQLTVCEVEEKFKAVNFIAHPWMFSTVRGDPDKMVPMGMFSADKIRPGRGRGMPSGVMTPTRVYRHDGRYSPDNAKMVLEASMGSSVVVVRDEPRKRGLLLLQVFVEKDTPEYRQLARIATDSKSPHDLVEALKRERAFFSKEGKTAIDRIIDVLSPPKEREREEA